jgi:hypothetical protein
MKRAAAGLAAALAATAALAVPPWMPVPGLPEVAIEAASIDVRGPVVGVSVRGSPAVLLRQKASWHRTVLRLHFDCAQRQVRTVGVLGYDGAGKAVHSSALPSPATVVGNDGVLDVLYDASCELGRALRLN